VRRKVVFKENPMRIEIVPDALAGAGSGLTGTGAQVDAACATLRAAASGVPGACGFPDAAGAFEDFASSWTGAIGRSADGVAGLGTVMQGAAALYRITDALAIP
jgi:hypothetical protein